jgi:hypothetical protein
MEKIIETSLGKLMDIVQLEPGKYRLTVSLRYRDPVSRVFNKQSEAKSSIVFSVGSDIREILRTRLRQTLNTSAHNALFDRTDAFTYPEYQPLDVEEE